MTDLLQENQRLETRLSELKENRNSANKDLRLSSEMINLAVHNHNFRES
jgi:hypothetical protein